MTLPDGFLWGVSTSAFQNEGALREDGRVPSVWDAFPVAGGDTAEVACDHYHRHAEDVALLRELGVGAYRFSVAWPRAAQLGFYDRLVDSLLDAGIAPVATLYHWDTPLAVEQQGGWLDRDTAHRFAEYASVVGDLLADRVALWIPVNEPAMVTLQGYGTGEHAPGRTLLYDALPVAHHLNLAHGLAVRALRAAGARAVGTANNHTPAWPAGPDDVEAAAAYSALHNHLFADPLLRGDYPAELSDRLPLVDGDLAITSEPLDFYGVNYYNPTRLRAPSEGNPLPFELVDITEYPRTDFGWPVVPSGLGEVVADLRDRYPDLPPVYVTESGCSCADLDDQDRIAYLDGHIAAAEQAGARGFFTWTLMDNFEWEAGYSQRFGLVHVDHATQRRTPRSSFAWYRDRIRR
ncbi:family 1 glycosylhydrolase [Actinosynnema sp. NPDC050436]|uniref:glycoside hydrolase family 1 protein n=1 Tax=Actinosynnema sp. NPDC050436 TaxID=3155659 RepID=UPI00341109C1